ncbi:MAG: glycosyltransferase family 4 protein [Pseudomonadota bacterium]
MLPHLPRPVAMNFLFVLPEYSFSGGGISTYYSSLLPALVDAGHSVRVLHGSNTISQPGGGSVRSNGVTVEIFDSAFHAKYLQLFARYDVAPKLAQHLAAAWGLWEQAQSGSRADIVEVTDWGLGFLPWLFDARPPLLVQLHGSIGQVAAQTPFRGEEIPDSLIQLIELRGLAAADQLQTSSHRNASFWQAQLNRSVDVARPLWRPPERAALPNADRTDKGLVVGRVQMWKGPHVLCEAIQLLGNRSLHIDWVGRDASLNQSGDSTAQYLRSAWPEVWGQQISWLPPESHAAILDRQRQAAFVLVPSIWDVFNMTCIEAMSAGTPVICSSAAGASELIQDGTDGFVYGSNDASELARAIDSFMTMPLSRRREIGAAAAATVEKALAMSVILPQRLAFYERAGAQPAALPLAADDWLSHIAQPARDPSESALHDSLDGLPLHKLLKYSFRRALEKAISAIVK